MNILGKYKIYLIILSTICSYTFAGEHNYNVIGSQYYGLHIEDDENVKVDLKLADDKVYKKINDMAENEVLNRHTTELVNHFNNIIDKLKFYSDRYYYDIDTIQKEIEKKFPEGRDKGKLDIRNKLCKYYTDVQSKVGNDTENKYKIIREYMKENLSNDIKKFYGEDFEKLKVTDKKIKEEIKDENEKIIKNILIEKDGKRYFPPSITLFSNKAIVKNGTSGVGYEVLSGENSTVVGNYTKANSNNSVVVGNYSTSSNIEKEILNENGISGYTVDKAIFEYTKDLIRKNKGEEYKRYASSLADSDNIPQDKREEFIRDKTEEQIELEARRELSNKKEIKKIQEEFFKEYSEHTIKNEKGEEIKFFLKKNLNSPTDDYNTVIGYFSHVKGQKGTAVGAFSRALDNSVALGFKAKSLSNNSITIGNNAENKTNNSVVIGYNASSPNAENNKFESNVVIGNMTKGLGKAVVSIGNTTLSTGENSISIGNIAQSTGTNSISMGNTAQSTGENSISIGNETKSINNGIAIGNKAFASDNNGSSTIAIGNEASATSSSAIAIGDNAKAGQMEISIGYNAQTYKIRDNIDPNENITLGNYAVSKGSRNIAFGMESRSEGYNSISIGEGAFSKSTSPEKFEAPSIALGHNAIAFGGSIALGKSATIAKGERIKFADENAKKSNTTGENAEYVFSSYENGEIYGYKKEDNEIMHGVAIGDYSLTNTENGVALGSYSLSNRKEGVLGYLSNNEKNYTWKSTYGAVSIGDPEKSITRQLTGLAAGSEDTDAVNVAQLKQVIKNQYINVKAGEKTINVKLGDTLVLKGNGIGISVEDGDKTSKQSQTTQPNTSKPAVTPQTAPTPAETKTPKEHTATFEVKGNVGGSNTFEYVLGEKVLSEEEYSKLKSDEKKNVILRVKDGEKVITNVANGVKAKDAVNVSQLKAVRTKVEKNTSDIQQLQKDVKEVDKKSDLALGGVSNAVAMANLPQVMGNKKFNLAASYGYYGGSHAVAVGFSGTNDNQNFIYKLSGSVNSKGNLAFGIGAGVMLGSVNSKDKRISDLENRLKEQTEKTNRLEKQLEKVMKRLGQN